MLNKKKKDAVVADMIDALGCYVETFEERVQNGLAHPDLTAEDAEEVMLYVAKIARKFPGGAWDIRLGNPNDPRIVSRHKRKKV